MRDTEKLELLKAALALAVADKTITRSERGVIEGLAAKVGVGEASLAAMSAAADRDETYADNILMTSPDSARTALELLVAQARIDGAISNEERELLVRLASGLNITGDAFQAIYQAGIARADAVRRSHGM